MYQVVSVMVDEVSHLGFIQTHLYIAQVNHWTVSILSLGVLAPHESKYLFQLHK